MVNVAGALARFARHSGGNFAVIAALAALPLMLMTGGVIDYSLMYSSKLRIQNAADAAALAAAKQYAVDPDPARLSAYAQSFFKSNTADLYRTSATLVYDGTSWTENHSRQLRLHVDFTYSPLFLPLSDSVDRAVRGKVVRVDSAVMVSDTTVEVAMVLDTSGSMADSPDAGGESKIVTLRRTARSAAAKFFAASGTGSDKPTMVAVVPFSGAVNVGDNNLDAWWMDPKGLSPLHHENFAWKTYTDSRGNPLATQSTDKGWYLTADPTTRLTRQYVMKNMKAPTTVLDTSICTYKGTNYPGCSWSGTDLSWVMKKGNTQVCTQAADPTGCHPYRITYAASPIFALRGCVEARGGAEGVTDATPDESKPETLFVPYMAADEPDGDGYNSYIGDEDMQFPPKVYPMKDGEFFARQRNMNKYLLYPQRARKTEGSNHLYSPNFICDSAPIQPLTADASVIDTTITNLQAVGATNVDEGVGWGWRVLSPSEPFAGSRPYSDDKNVKALILMTDGENTSYTSGNSDKSWFSSYGFAQVPTYSTDGTLTGTKGGRIFDQSGQSVIHSNSNYTLAMDGRTKKVCANAKNDGKRPMTDVNGAALVDERGQVQKDGIVIYTIAFDIPATSAARVNALLSDCASYKDDDLRDTALPYAKKGKNFYAVKNAAELDQAFSDIAASLSKMRVSR